MFVDATGALWLSDPSVVMLVLAGAVASIVWCHRWLETGRAPMPRMMAIRVQGPVRQSPARRRRPLARSPRLTVVQATQFANAPAAARRPRQLPLTAA